MISSGPLLRCTIETLYCAGLSLALANARQALERYWRDTREILWTRAMFAGREVHWTSRLVDLSSVLLIVKQICIP